MTTVDPRPQVAAIKTAVKAQLGPNDPFEYDELPGTNGNAGTPPNIFVLVSVERRHNATVRASAQAGSVGWRAAFQCVGRTIDEASWALYHVGLALNEKRLVIDGRSTTPIQFESDEAPQYDDGRYSARCFYTYAH